MADQELANVRRVRWGLDELLELRVADVCIHSLDDQIIRVPRPQLEDVCEAILNDSILFAFDRDRDRLPSEGNECFVEESAIIVRYYVALLAHVKEGSGDVDLFGIE